MKILHLLILFFWTGFSLAEAVDEYRIAGTVTKKGGGSLEGVTVLLKGKDVSAVTGEDGTFEIASPVSIRMKAEQRQTLSFKLHGNAVRFSPIERHLSGNVSIFSGNGRRVGSINFSNLNPMTEQIKLPQLASGLNIIRLVVNNNVYTCQLMRLGNKLHLTSQSAVSRSDENFTLGKTMDSEAVDTLVATKENFKESVTSIDSYNINDVTIEMDSVVEETEIAWGRKENPTDHCTIDSLAGYSELKASSKLPDPFKKLDGTRITSKSEWACQRELIYQQLLKYIYGAKPTLPKDAVSGTVSETEISVNVNDGQRSCKFSVTVKMNGASKPAPAFLQYASGASAPGGVAQISFSPKEVSGGSGSKSGAFYDFYGGNHEAGYLVAWAWQVSRIIDVLEQNPGIIDPGRIAVTGCSRFGKGAFVAGVLDNRVALTIPVESGIGGTVALRLVEQLDASGGEWPYHAISYVRWFSEVALGKFTSGNNASGDNTDRLPVDMHSAMALIAPRGLYIVDNPSGTYRGLDARSAWVTANVGKKIFEALGVGDNFSCVGASGSHCSWRDQYSASLNAMVNKFLKGDNSASTGAVSTDLGNKPNPEQYYDWDVPALDGEL